MDPIEECDLITIIGSLEHCKDPKKVPTKMLFKPQNTGLIIIEGRYFPNRKIHSVS